MVTVLEVNGEYKGKTTVTIVTWRLNVIPGHKLRGDGDRHPDRHSSGIHS